MFGRSLARSGLASMLGVLAPGARGAKKEMQMTYGSSCFKGVLGRWVALGFVSVLVLGAVGSGGMAQAVASGVGGESKAAARDARAKAQARAVETAREACRELRKRLALPGLSAAVAAEGEVVWAEGFGQADLENPTDVTPQSRFRIGSLSKLVAVAAVARLVDEGKLDLDAPVQDYVPYFPEKKWKLTTRQLCCHTAGIRHYGPNDGLEANKRFDTVREGVGIFAGDPLLFQPGTAYSYSSYGYNLVSAVVEGASGKEFLEYLGEAVVKPLGLESTCADDNRAVIPHRVEFYHVNPDGSVVHSPYVDNSYKWAGGGMLSTPSDLARLALAHLEPGFLGESTLREVFTPQPASGNDSFKVGLGWRIGQDADGRKIYHHGGAIAGGRAYILVYPLEGIASVLMSNTFARFGMDEAGSVASGFLPVGE